MAERLREVEGGVFIQSESEVAAIHMVIGASAAGARSMTSSSSPGISLKQEDLLAGGLRTSRRDRQHDAGRSGVGQHQPVPGDYFQATRGGGHGDYRVIVLGPDSAQELADLTMDAFDLADRYRTPVMILADGMMGQMMEPVIFKTPKPRAYPESFIMKGAGAGKSKIIRGLILDPLDMEEHNWTLDRKYQVIARKETPP